MRHLRSVLKKFLVILSGFNVISKKKKKGYHADGGIFLDFMLISKKKKVLRLSSASFLRSSCDIQECGDVNRSCLRFLAREKMPEFAKYLCENAEKNFALFCAYREHWCCLRPVTSGTFLRKELCCPGAMMQR